MNGYQIHQYTASGNNYHYIQTAAADGKATLLVGNGAQAYYYGVWCDDKLHWGAGTDPSYPKMTMDSSGNFGIGTTAPDNTLHVFTASAGSVTAHTGTDDIVAENSDHAGISILTPNDKVGSLTFGDPDDNDVGYIAYAHSDNTMYFHTDGGGFTMALDPNQRVGIGTASPDGPLHVFTASAGSVTAAASGDELILENSGSTGMTILTPDANSSYISSAYSH